MFLVVLRTLAAYGAASAAAMALAARFVLPVRIKAALLLAAAPLIFTGEAMVTGGVYAPLDIAFHAPPLAAHRAEAGIGPTRNPLIVDVVSQMIPWRKVVRETLGQGRLPLWNPYLLAGEPLLGVQQPAVLHPGTWMGLLLPPPQAWTFDMSLRLFIAALSAFLFFRGSGAGETAALFGAAAWSFSDFLVFYVGYPVTSSVGPFPLLLLGLRSLVQAGDRRAVGLTAGALFLTAIAGHPETLLFAVTGGGIFFLVELALAPRGRRWRAVGLSLLAGSIALGLSAVVLLPFLEIFRQTWQHAVRVIFYAKGVRSEELRESLRRFVPTLMPYAYGTLGRSHVLERLAVPAGYAGALLFPLAASGALGRGRGKWPLLAIGAFGLALNVRLIGITEVVTKLPLFDIAVGDYFIFLAVFALAALAVLGLERLRSGEGLPVLAAASVLSVATLALLGASRQGTLAELGMSPDYARLRILLQVVPLLFALGVVLARTRQRLSGESAGALLLVLLVAERGAEEHGVYPTCPARAFFPRLEFLQRIPRDPPSRIAGLSWALTPNTAALYDLEDVRGYDAMVLGSLAQTFELWCVPLPSYFNRVDDPATPFLSFLNVRHVIVPPRYPAPAGWSLVSQELGTRVYENPKALPRAFVPRHVVWVEGERSEMRVLKRIEDFANDGVVGRWRPGPLGWQTNGEASIAVGRDSSDRLSLRIDARSEVLVGTSIPGWKGWKLWIDGRRAPLHPFNRAFLAFVVSEGRHEAVLRYLPDGFLYGSALTLATAIACVLLSLRRGRRARP